jgi:hypothetical protein
MNARCPLAFILGLIMDPKDRLLIQPLLPVLYISNLPEKATFGSGCYVLETRSVFLKSEEGWIETTNPEVIRGPEKRDDATSEGCPEQSDGSSGRGSDNNKDRGTSIPEDTNRRNDGSLVRYRDGGVYFSRLPFLFVSVGYAKISELIDAIWRKARVAPN